MKNIIIGVVCIIGILLVLFYFFGNKSGNEGFTQVGDNFSSIVAENAQTTDNKTDKINDIKNTEINKINNIDNTKNMNDAKKELISATIDTNMGSIVIEFFSKDAPNTVANFTKLAGSKFYDGIKFHRVIKGFMIQGGDPLTKDDTKVAQWGTGGPGYKFADEINAKSDLYTKVGYKKGIVAMANSGSNTNGSQFFIMNSDYSLPPLYTIFGKVISGQDVVDKIALVKTAPGDIPVDPVIIKSVTLK